MREVLGQAVAESKSAMHGKTVWYVRCSCGHRNQFYVWSWAGHGIAVCKGCGEHICYRTLQVIKNDKKRK